MFKVLFLVIVLVAILPAFADLDVGLKKLGFVLAKMDTANINNWNCVPRVWNDGVNTYVSFTTDIGNAAPVDVYNGMKSYMAGATGSATSTYSGDGASFIMVYKGDYDPNLLPPGPLQSLADVICKYDNPILGDYVCKQQVFKSKSGWAYVGITVPLAANDTYQDACDSVYEYLRGQGYLDSTSKKITSYSDASGDYGFLELWANE